jgi:LCP family protein required for cell wall assembly
VVVAVERVFAAPSATSTTTTPLTTTSTSEPTVQQPTATIITTTTTTAASEEEPPWGEHLVLLLLGGDGGPDRDGVRTDAMLVVAVRSEDATISVFSLPRNLRGFPFPNGQGFDDILNAVYRFGEEHPERFTGHDSGASALEGVVEAILGVRVDHHVLVDFEAFRAGVDALGGVTLPVPLTVTYPGFRLADGSRVDMVIEEGMRDLDGDMALAYVRSREEGTDYGRMERQKCVLAALLDQAEPAQALLALPSLLGAFEETVSTDIPRDVLPDIVTLLADVDLDRVGLITLGPPAWHAGWIAGGWPIPDVPRIQEAVAAALDGAPPLDAGLIPATTSCGL